MVEGAKLAFAFTKDEAEINKMRELKDEEEEGMVKAEAPEFWVEWPNFEWMDDQAVKEGEEEEEIAKRERSDGIDGETPAREKRRKVALDEDED